MSVLGPISILQSANTAFAYMGGVTANKSGDLVWIVDDESDGGIEINAQGEMIVEFSDEKINSMQITATGNLNATYII